LTDDYFMGFAAHAHTLNELELDPQKESDLRRRNSPEEARRLADSALEKLERDIRASGHDLGDVKLLILYQSYRGDTADKDADICRAILKAVETRFTKPSGNLRLVGHTTAGELENDDLELAQISGIGYNGLSLLALATNLPVGVGRTWGLRTPDAAREQGGEMARDAWVDYSQQAANKDHLHVGKTLLVLTQGSKVDTPGYEHFLAEGIASFMGSTSEARIMNVIGGSSGDGVAAQHFHQFYGRLKEHPEFKVVEGEAVCALIPNVSSVSMGVALSGLGGVKVIGKQYLFHFDPDREPHYKYVKRIGKDDPSTKCADAIFENEVKLAKDKGLPMPDKEVIREAFRLARAQERLLIFNPIVARYAFAFPFGNYCCIAGVRVVGDDIELILPVRSYAPEMPGYFIIADHELLQKGTRHVYNMLRADQGFSPHDSTFLVSCINRRIVELMAGCASGTEAEILKEGLSSTQVIGFLAYGEISFTHLLQEPYFHAFSCWGITLHSKGARPPEAVTDDRSMQTPKRLPGRVATGNPVLDDLLCGGIPENYAVALTAPAGAERDSLVVGFLKQGVDANEVAFLVTADPGLAKSLTKSDGNAHLFICNPQANADLRNHPNTVTLKGVENLTDISIALSSAISRLDPSRTGPKRIAIELLSDVLLRHHAVQTRRWLTALITELKSKKFTVMAVMDPRIHPSEELYAILGLFDGEISLHEKETERGVRRYLKVTRMGDQEYMDSELPVKRKDPYRKG
jgi:KaiC/GvpD/RAD55 family RecA-like ATPase